MKKIKLLYNPNAGNTSIRSHLDSIIKKLQEGDYDVWVRRSGSPGDITEQVSRLAWESFDSIAVCGGDGSLHLTINAMKNNQMDIPLGIIPAGTANDFAGFLKIPGDFGKAAGIITEGNQRRVDLGLVNGRYFINVCAAGMFGNISQRVDINIKNTFGKLAYYIKGMERLPNFMPLPARITHKGAALEDEIFFFLVLNTSGAGGFDRLSPGASVDDGMFDFVAFRARPIHELAMLFVKVLAGDYLDDSRVIFFRDSHIKIEILDKTEEGIYMDLDGEMGPVLPAEIYNLPSDISVFAP